MKQGLKVLRYFLWLCIIGLINTSALAQGDSGSTTSTTTTTTTKSTDINLTTNSGDWYTQPWVWIIGAAVFILLLIALLSGSRRNSTTTGRVTVKKTVERDTDSGV